MWAGGSRYLLVRLEPLIRDLEKSITLLTMIVARQSNIDVEQVQQILEGGRETCRARERFP
jgi:hypothetical protein